MGRLVDIGDTALHIEERGDADAFPLLVFHGGPGLDHHMFGTYLDPLTDAGRYRLVLVDERSQGQSTRTDPSTWTIQHMAADVTALAGALDITDRYATLGHSYGAFVVLQHAVDHSGEPKGTIVSAGVASSRWLEHVETELERFEPENLRQQVTDSWAGEATVQTEDEAARILGDQMPFHFRDPTGPLIDDYVRNAPGTRFSPDVLRHFATQEYGGIDVTDRLGDVTHPVLVLSGRYDRTCPVGAGEEMAKLLPDAELVVFEDSAHMLFVEENARYITAVRQFLDRIS